MRNVCVSIYLDVQTMLDVILHLDEAGGHCPATDGRALHNVGSADSAQCNSVSTVIMVTVVPLLLLVPAILTAQDTGHRRAGPRFEFYTYNDAGTMVKQLLTVQQIQQLMVHQSSQQLGPSLALSYYLIVLIGIKVLVQPDKVSDYF